jgi:hypothetical protein
MGEAQSGYDQQILTFPKLRAKLRTGEPYGVIPDTGSTGGIVIDSDDAAFARLVREEGIDLN